MMVARWSVTLGDHAGVVAPSPDGTSIVVGSLAGDAIVVDAGTGDTLAKLADHPMGVLTAAWSHDGQRLAVGGQDGVLRVYRSDATLVAAVPLDGWVAGLAWSPGGQLATGAGRTLTVLDLEGAVVRRYPDQVSTVTAVAWSVDGSRVGAAAYGGVRWYDPGMRREDEGDEGEHSPARTFAWRGSLLSLAVSPTGKWACGGAQDSTVHIWRLWSGTDLSMSGYPTKIEHLAFRHDGRWLAVGCLGDLTVWDFGGRGPSGTQPARGEGHDRHITALAWQPSGDQVATGGADGQVVVWPSPSSAGRTLRPLAVHESATPVGGLAWTPTGNTLVVGNADGQVELLGSPDGN